MAQHYSTGETHLTPQDEVFGPERRARIVALLASQGKRWTLGGKSSGRWLAIAHENDEVAAGRLAQFAAAPGRYRVVYSYPTEEGQADDPGSRLCECPHSAQSHDHWVGYRATLDEAIGLAEQIWIGGLHPRDVGLQKV